MMEKSQFILMSQRNINTLYGVDTGTLKDHLTIDVSDWCGGHLLVFDW
jgi:hypothetical protein